MKKRNGIIGIWKFIFSLLILGHHFYAVNDGGVKHSIFICGAIGVDFFFIVSGYLLAKKVASENRRKDTTPLYKSTWKFLLRKIQIFYPYLLTSFILLLIAQVIVGKWNTFKYIDSLNDLFLLQGICVKSTRMVGGSWYLSCMILAMLFVYPMLKKYGKTFSCIITPLLITIWGGFLFNTEGSLRAWASWTGFICVGLSKAVLEISLGCSVYDFSEYLRKIPFTNIAKILLGILQTAFFCIVIYMNALFDWVRPLDWMFILMLSVGIAIAFSDILPWTDFASNRLFLYLEQLSTPIFMNNFVGIKIVNSVSWFAQYSWRSRCLMMSAIVILLSIVELWVIEHLRKLDYSGLKKKFIIMD